MKFRTIAVEGPIGVGKTSFVELLAGKFDAHRVLEDVENPFLEQFYRDQQGAAFQAQLLLHNCMGWNHYAYQPEGAARFLEYLQSEEPTFLLYRDNQVVTCTAEGVFVSLYRFSDRAVAVVANHNRETTEADLRIDWQGLGLQQPAGEVRSLETGGQLSAGSRPHFMVAVEPRGYCLLELR